ncbi:MAG: efflux RND transporter periplasmic adaptor subunit [Cyanobacteria bacterium REEB67]|nr:efflux RND transporter periplasmic adaptor subunit [Cyanobacteria bacterium REEB67]
MTLALILVLVPFCLTGCQKAPEPDTKADLITVHTVAAREQIINEVVELSGSVVPEPNRSARVTSLSPGVLAYVGPHVGDWVAKDQVVARLEDTMQKAQLHQMRAALLIAQANWSKAKHGSRPQEIEQAKAALEVAQANEVNAEQNEDRLKKLYEEQISAGRDYDLAVSQEAVADSQVKAAEANLSMIQKGLRPEDREAARAQADQAAGVFEQSKATLDLTQLRSPIKGVVAERYLDVGDQAGPTAPTLLVVDPTIVYVQATLPVGYNERLAPGQDVQIILPDSKVTLSGHLLKIGMKLDPVTNAVPVQIEVPNDKLRLKFGMVVKARINIDKRMAIVVPKSSLIGSADNPGREVVNLIQNGVSKPAVVECGTVDGDVVEIKKGLHRGDTVTTDVNYELPEGTAVAVK